MTLIFYASAWAIAVRAEGESMCLSIAVHEPERVTGKGEHMGYEWNVVHNTNGYRCGYVRVPPGHPWHGKDDSEVDADVHGGLTFARADEPCDKGGPDQDWWLGFDCQHAGDAPDPLLPCDPRHRHFVAPGDVIRTQEYV